MAGFGYDTQFGGPLDGFDTYWHRRRRNNSWNGNNSDFSLGTCRVSLLRIMNGNKHDRDVYYNTKDMMLTNDFKARIITSIEDYVMDEYVKQKGEPIAFSDLESKKLMYVGKVFE